MPADCIASSTWPWNCFDSGTSGRRMPSWMRPMRATAHLTGIGLRLEEHRLVQRLQLRIELARQLAVAGERGVDDGAHLPRRDVGGHRNDALEARQHALARQVVVAAEQRHAAADACEVLAIALERGRFLDADDVRNRRAVARRSPASCRSRSGSGTLYSTIGIATRSAIGLVVLVQAFLRRLVVVRRDQQAGIRAGILRELRQLDRFARRVRAGAGDDRDALGGALHHSAHDVDVLFDAQRRRFAGRADRDDAVGAVVDVELDQAIERPSSTAPSACIGVTSATMLPLNMEILAKGSYWRAAAPCKARRGKNRAKCLRKSVTPPIPPAFVHFDARHVFTPELSL